MPLGLELQSVRFPDMEWSDNDGNTAPPPGPEPFLQPDPPLYGEESSGPGRVVALAVVVVLLLGGVVAAAVVLLGGRADDAADGSQAASTVVEVSTTDLSAPATALATTLAPPTAAPSTPVPEPVDVFSGSNARDALDGIAAELGAPSLRVLEVNVYPTYVIASVQDPANPANVDRVVWRDGGISDRSPVRLSVADDLDAERFDVAEVAWGALPGLVEASQTLLAIDDGEVTHVHVARRLPFTDAIEVRVFVTGPRASGFVDAAADGTVLDVNPG